MHKSIAREISRSRCKARDFEMTPGYVKLETETFAFAGKSARATRSMVEILTHSNC